MDENIFPPGREETLAGSGNTTASLTAAAPSESPFLGTNSHIP